MSRRSAAIARRSWSTAFVAALLSCLATPSLAQTPDADWPTRPVRIVVPYGAGSSADVFTRIVSERLQQRLGQPVFVENEAGEGGMAGTAMVAKAYPDGYTFVVSSQGPLVHDALLYRGLPYDPFTDLRPVVFGGAQSHVCTVRADSGIGSMQELVAAMKAHPGRYAFASDGAGGVSHLVVELLKARSGAFAVHVPYASAPQAILSVLQGDTQFACMPIVAVAPQVRAGRLRALAVTGGWRSALMPEVVTMEEAGLSGMATFSWMAFMAPASTPTPIVERLNAELNAVLATPEVLERLLAQYIEPVGGSAEDLRSFLRAERERMAPVVERSGAASD